MTFIEAMRLAQRESVGCVQHVNGRILAGLDDQGEPVAALDPHGWHASDWYTEGATAASFVNGMRRD